MTTVTPDESWTLTGHLSALAARSPNAVALHYKGETVRFAQLFEDSRRIAAGLAEMGVGRGSLVALWMPNAPAWVATYFALARLGATALALNTRFKSSELRDILARSGASAVLYWPGYGGLAFTDILSQALEGLPELQYVIAYEENDVVDSVALNGRPITRFEELLAHAPLSADAGSEDDPTVIFTTSGTTNLPKLVVHSQRGVVSHAGDVARAFGFDQPQAMTLQMIPFCGTYGFTQAIAVLLAGRSLVVHPSFDAPEAVRLIRHHKIDRAGMTDEMIRRTVDATSDREPFPGITFFTGVRAQELVSLSTERAFAVIGIYGSSEAQAFFARQKPGPDRMRMAEGGGYPVPIGAQLRIRHPETRDLLPFGEPGELEIKSPSLFIRYHGDEAATRAAFTDDGFFKSGDHAVLREDGSYSYLTRAGEVLRLGGFLVNPAEIESHIEKHPSVLRCQVIGVPQKEARNGVEVTAFYTVREGSAATANDLFRHCKSGIAHYKVPQKFVALKEFPMVHSANTSKIARKDLFTIALRESVSAR